MSVSKGPRWLVALAALALAAGCGGGKPAAPEAQATPNVVQPGAPGEPTRQVSADAERSHTAPTEADVRFMRDMIHHHGQAVLMTAWVPERAASRNVKLIAKRMALSQEGEIELMQSWLEQRGVPAEDPGDHAGHHSMPGMLSPARLDRLKAVRGAAFDRVFLRSMTTHHRGALTMVRRLRAAGGGAESEIDAFARHVESDQQIEISRMQDLLAAR